MGEPDTVARAPRAADPEVSSSTTVRGRAATLFGRLPGGLLALLAAGLVLTVMSWPLASLQPGSGLDPSWRTGLDMAVQDGLDFGSDIIFTHGPLGFLRSPAYAYPWTARLAFGYVLLLQLALCLTLLWALRRNLGSLVIAVPVTLVIAPLVAIEPVLVIVLAALVALLRDEVPPRARNAILAGVGALVAIQLLAKLSTAVTVAGLSAIALVALREGRRAAAGWFGGALVLTLVVAWLLTGQSLSAVPSYLASSLQIVSGYSESMGLEEPGRQWELWAALALTAIGLYVIAWVDVSRPPRIRYALAAIWLLLAFTAFKAGFVRHSTGHAGIFFATMLGGLAVLPLMRLPRFSTILALLLATTALVATIRVDPTDLVDPLGRPGAFFEQTGTLADGQALNDAIVAARERVAREYEVAPEIIAALRGHNVHVDPYDAAVPWAFQLAWRPVPVFQSYAAYTAGLDERNAEAFAAPDGPDRVLRRNVDAIDGRSTAWESPAAMRAMLCNFRPTLTRPPWQLLERTEDRCGRPRGLGQARARFGEAIAVPRAPTPRSMVYVELEGVAVAGLERVRNALYRAQERFVTIDGQRNVRLVPGTAANGLIMRVGSAVDLPAPFGLDQGARGIVVTRGAGKQPDGEVRARFFAVELR